MSSETKRSPAPFIPLIFLPAVMIPMWIPIIVAAHHESQVSQQATADVSKIVAHEKGLNPKSLKFKKIDSGNLRAVFDDRANGKNYKLEVQCESSKNAAAANGLKCRITHITPKPA